MRYFPSVAVLVLSTGVLNAVTPDVATDHTKSSSHIDQSRVTGSEDQLVFTPNQWQWPDSILFRAESQRLVVWLVHWGCVLSTN